MQPRPSVQKTTLSQTLHFTCVSLSLYVPVLCKIGFAGSTAHTAGSSFQMTLNKFQTMTIRSQLDLTATKIEANNVVTVLGVWTLWL